MNGEIIPEPVTLVLLAVGADSQETSFSDIEFSQVKSIADDLEWFIEPVLAPDESAASRGHSY